METILEAKLMQDPIISMWALSKLLP
jgi:hypothetical protein